jgi:leucine dehydrogenase
MIDIDKKLNKLEDLFEFSTHEKFENLHFKWDEKLNLKAIVAIHNTKLGPALGGCRFIEYPNTDTAIIDALRLARGMSYKSAMADLPHGGGKSVIIKPAHIPDEEAYFEAFGEFIHSLSGRYITAKDSGSTLEHMDIIARKTPYVASTSEMVDPSPFTALGIFQGILAAVHYQLKRKSLEDVHVSLQGVGSVGYYLAKLLHAEGARLTVYDVSQDAMKRCQEEFGASLATADTIYTIDCDVFSPCALGAILNDQTIPLIKAPIIAGAANNQLAQERHGQMLFDKGILYTPDYVVNAAGVIHAAYKYNKKSDEEAHQKILNLYHVLTDVFEQSTAKQKPTNIIADEIAYAKLHD